MTAVQAATISARRRGMIREFPARLPIPEDLDLATLGVYVMRPRVVSPLCFGLGEHGILRMHDVLVAVPHHPLREPGVGYRIYGTVVRLDMQGAKTGPEGLFEAGDDDVYALVTFDRLGGNGVVHYRTRPFVIVVDP